MPPWSRAHDWIWLVGNHDPRPPAGLGGHSETELEVAGTTFRHIPAAEPGGLEIAGHLHPSARVTVRGRRLARPCFVCDGRRMILPAFGSYAGGLDVFDPAIAGLFAAASRSPCWVTAASIPCPRAAWIAMSGTGRCRSFICALRRVLGRRSA